jgi:hypothetical protein
MGVQVGRLDCGSFLTGWGALMDLMEWIAETTDNASARRIASRLNRSNDSVSRWLKRGDMPADVIIQLARVYDGNLLEGVLAGGVIVPEDVEKAMPSLLRYAPMWMLTEELHRRTIREARAERTASS